MKENFKNGDRVRVVSLVSGDEEAGLKIGCVGTITRVWEGGVANMGADVEFDGIKVPKESSNRAGKNSIAMHAYQLELVQFEIPASPFYVSIRMLFSTKREICKIEVDGLRYKVTAVSGGCEVFNGSAQLTRDIPGFFESGSWQLADPPAPAVDPVVALTERVQQLLREQADAGRVVDSAHDALNAAQEKQRDIGKLLREAQRALDKSIHEAAGVKWDAIKNGPIREIAEILADAR